MSQAFRLDNQVAVVTGACGRLGPIWAQALLGAGARVAALDMPGALATASSVILVRRRRGSQRSSALTAAA